MTNNDCSESTIRVGTFFSGIGAPEKAFQKLKEEKIIKDYKIEFFSEIDKNAIKSYCAVHNVDELLNLGSITEIKGNELPYCDIWIGGFPCQDISCAGKMKGFDLKSATRSSLGWEMIRLLREVKNKPKYVIFENVENITSKPFRETLSLFKQDLINLGYTLYDKVLDATKYDMPQTRKRYFLVAILDNKKVFTFDEGNGCRKKIIDFLDKNVDEKYYLTTGDFKKIAENKIIFTKKNDATREYEIDLNKYKIGGVCGKDKKCKFAQSSRVFSQNGYAPTLTANNTSDNFKILVEED